MEITLDTKIECLFSIIHCMTLNGIDAVDIDLKSGRYNAVEFSDGSEINFTAYPPKDEGGRCVADDPGTGSEEETQPSA